MKILYPFVALVLLASGCSKNGRVKLDGTYTEISPEKGRFKLEFVDKSTLRKTENAVITEYAYVIENSVLKLTTNGPTPVTTEHSFKKQGHDKIKVGNLTGAPQDVNQETVVLKQEMDDDDDYHCH